MKSYTLGNWDGSLMNGNTKALSGAKTSEAADVRKASATINEGSQTGAFNTNEHIPRHDTPLFSGGSKRGREINGAGKPPLNAVQHTNVSYTGTNPSTHFTVNGCLTYTKNGTQNIFTRFNNKPSLNRISALSGHRENSLKYEAILATSLRALVSPQPDTQMQLTTATTSQNTLDIRDAADDQGTSKMDEDDSGSSADAEGEDVDEDRDASLINDMLLQPESSSSSPARLSGFAKDGRQLSPLFSPRASPKDNNGSKAVEPLFIPSSPSPVACTRDFPTTVARPGPPSSSLISPAPDIFSLPITTTNPQKQRKEVVKPRGRRRKRLVLSHIEIPPSPSTCSQDTYLPMSSLMALHSPIVIPRSAKQLAHLKVQKTMAENRRIASEINLDVGRFDDERDQTYKPSSYSPKKKNAIPRLSRPPVTVSPAAPVAASWQIFTKEPNLPNNAETGVGFNYLRPVFTDTTGVSTKEPSPPNNTEYNPTPIPVTEHIRAGISTPAGPSIQDLSFGPDSSPLSSLPSSQIAPLCLPLPSKAEKKRKYKKRSGDEGCETESDSPKLKKKFKAAQDSLNKDKNHNPPAIVQRNISEEKKERQELTLSGYHRYDVDRDILRFFIRGIPSIQHPVLAMNTRHVRQCKDLHQDQSYFGAVSVTIRSSAVARTFLAPPLPSSTVAEDEDHYYLGGVVRELAEIENGREDVEASLPPKKRGGEDGENSASQDVSLMIPSLSGSNIMSPVTPKHSGQGQDEAGCDKFETENILHMDQFLTDFGASPNTSSQQQQSSSSDNVDPLSGGHLTTHRLQDDEYGSEALSRALVSADRDPFLSSGNDWASYIPESPTADKWRKRAEDKDLNEPAVVNDTIDPSVLRGDDFEEPPVVQDYHLEEDPVIYSTSRPISPQAVGSKPQQPYSELGILPADDDPFSSPSPDSPLSISAHRPVVAPRRLMDMVDIRDLDLCSSHSSNESDMDETRENKDPEYKASKPAVETQQRKGPRIVSAKELARIQRGKALEREKEEKRLMAFLKSTTPKSTTPSAPAIQAKRLGRKPKIRAPPMRSKWECGSDYTSCHHCRTRSYRLKMACKCGRLWCNACTLTKYDHPFDVNLRDWNCPCCQNACRCDLCTKKRGEVYVSKRNWGPLSKVTTKDVQVMKTRSAKRAKTKRNPFLSSEEENDFGLANEREDESTISVPRQSKRQVTLRAEMPFPQTEIVGVPGSHWAAVYSLTGERVTTATVGEGNRSVIVSCSVETLLLAAGVSRCKKRVFIGRIQPCWGHDMVHKSTVRQLRSGNEDDSVKRLTRDDEEKRKNPRFKKRVYIGNPDVFLELGKRNKKEKDKPSPVYDVEVPDEDSTQLRFFAYSLSPLSSLSPLPESDIEDEKWSENLDNAVMDEDGKHESGTNPANSASSGLYRETITDTDGHAQQSYHDVDASGTNDYADGGGEDERGRLDGVQLVNEAVQDGQKAAEVVASACLDGGENATNMDTGSCGDMMEIHRDGQDGPTPGIGLISLTEKDMERAIQQALSALRARESVCT